MTFVCSENALKRKATYTHAKTAIGEQIYGCDKKLGANFE